MPVIAKPRLTIVPIFSGCAGLVEYLGSNGDVVVMQAVAVFLPSEVFRTSQKLAPYRDTPLSALAAMPLATFYDVTSASLGHGAQLKDTLLNTLRSQPLNPIRDVPLSGANVASAALGAPTTRRANVNGVAHWIIPTQGLPPGVTVQATATVLS